MSSYHHQAQQQYYDDRMMYDNQYRTQTPLLPPKTKKNKFLKGSLAAIKNVLLKSTKPLRRQNSMAETKSERPKAAIGLRRQQSMMEHRDAYTIRSPQFPQRQQQVYDELDYSQRQRMNRIYPSGDSYYGDTTYMNQSDRIYDNYPNANSSQNYYEQENLYANRALIELERKSHELQQYGGGEARSGTRIVRRHSMADRTTNRSSPMIGSRIGDSRKRCDPSMDVREDIYQTRSGAFMMDPHLMRNVIRTRDEEAIYQSRREMHLDHLYQSKKEMQQRIHQGRLEVERAAMSESPSLPSSSSATTPVLSDQASSIRDPIYQSRRELKEKGFKTRTQLRDHIYQTRRETMESMAEPMYVSSKRVEVQRHQEPVIYESKEVELVDVVKQTAPIAIAEQSPDDMPINSELLSAAPSMPTIANQNSRNSSGSDDESILISPNQSDLHKSVAAPTVVNDQSNAIVETAESPMNNNTPLSPRADRAHLSNIIKRIAPQPPPRTIEQNDGNYSAGMPINLQASRTSIETHYTSSQISLPIGPPAAQSTPYTSDMMLEKPNGAHGNDLFNPPLREQTTTRGKFDENGGTLSDNVWNVSINIPPGAIPAGVQQEIYFTVTDPRMSQDVGGPPLDMENGWCYLSILSHSKTQ